MRIRTPIDIGLLIRERRRSLGLDQRALAVRVGVSRQWIVGVEGGKPRVAIGLLLRTLQALGLDLRIEAEPQASPKSRRLKTGRAAIPTIDLDDVIEKARGRRR